MFVALIFIVLAIGIAIEISQFTQNIQKKKLKLYIQS